jgi:trehalose 6-phosphate phosphatase
MSRARKIVPSLLANWSDVAARLETCGRATVFLDFDGTLVAIAPRPDLVRLSPVMRNVLKHLARNPRFTVVVISGRRRAELLRYIRVPGIYYFGLYGWERTVHSPLPKPALRALQDARAKLSTHLSTVPGLWVEDKHFSLSVHFLDVPLSAQPHARRKLRSLLRPFRKTLRAIENIRDTEVVPCCIRGKGDTVQQLLAKSHLVSKSDRSAGLPFYFGDDLSDEPAFEALKKGISVRVGATRPTRARYSLRGPAAVAAALAKLGAAFD